MLVSYAFCNHVGVLNLNCKQWTCVMKHWLRFLETNALAIELHGVLSNA